MAETFNFQLQTLKGKNLPDLVRFISYVHQVQGNSGGCLTFLPKAPLRLAASTFRAARPPLCAEPCSEQATKFMC